MEGQSSAKSDEVVWPRSVQPGTDQTKVRVAYSSWATGIVTLSIGVQLQKLNSYICILTEHLPRNFQINQETYLRTPGSMVWTQVFASMLLVLLPVMFREHVYLET